MVYFFKDETVWLNASQMAELFDRDYKTIRKHINNVLALELNNEVVVAKFAHTTQHCAIENKNHVFIDGNKRIAATLFIYFLNFYGILYNEEEQVIDNNTLVAITLLIAQSNPNEKDILVDLVMNFLNNK